MNKSNIKSNWSKLESNSAMGRIPKRRVGGFVSRSRQFTLLGTQGEVAADAYTRLEQKRSRDCNIDCY